MEMLLDDYQWQEVQVIGGWKTHKAMERYVNINILAQWKRRKVHLQDTKWKEELAPKIAPRASDVSKNMDNTHGQHLTKEEFKEAA